MNVFWLIVLSLPEIPADPCAWREPPPHERAGITLAEYHRTIDFRRPYDALWGECHKGDAPKARFTAVYTAPGLEPIRVDKEVTLTGGLWPRGRLAVSETIPLCPKPLGRRVAGAVLRGPAGRAQWHNPVHISIRLTGTGALAPLNRSDEVDVLCPACPDDTGGNGPSSYRSSQGGDKPLRLVYNLPATDVACAAGGGSLVLRTFWNEPGKDEHELLVPARVVADLQKRFVAAKGQSRLEVAFTQAEVCRPGKTFVWELVGLDSFSDLADIGSLSSGRLFRRGTIEGSRCSE